MKLLLILLVALSARTPDTPSTCTDCAEWNQPQAAFRIFGNTYYVGVKGLSCVLVSTSEGLILVDGCLPQSAPLIEANIRTLGFRVEDIKLIVSSHAHFDHAGGIAALVRDSGATVAASLHGARTLEAGELLPDDPQFGFGSDSTGFPPVAHVRVVQDGESLHVGDVAMMAHATPGHTPGSTSWTWRSCEGGRCLDVVCADSLNPVAAPGFRFLGDRTHPSTVAAFKRSIRKVSRLPCDILLTVHPGFSNTFDKLARLTTADANPFIESGACRAYAEDATKRLNARLDQERAPAPVAPVAPTAAPPEPALPLPATAPQPSVVSIEPTASAETTRCKCSERAMQAAQGSTMAMLNSLAGELQKLEDALAREVASQRSELDGTALQAFVLSEKAWAAYRDAEVAYCQSLYEGGTLELLNGPTCAIDLTCDRLEQVRAWK